MLSRLELKDISHDLECLLWKTQKVMIIYNNYNNIQNKFKTNIQKKYLFSIWDKLVDNIINNRIRFVIENFILSNKVLL